MKRTLSIGGATEDVFVQTGKRVPVSKDGRTLELPLGEKIRVEQVIETCGGGASNTAVGLARLGCEAHFCGILGSDQWGQTILENFKKERVDTHCATIIEGETSSFSIILSSPAGERVILYDSGTNRHLHDANFDRDHAATMNWLYLNHIHERSCVIEDDIVAILKKNQAVKLTWNPGGEHVRSGLNDAGNVALLRETDFLIMNKEEALAFTGMKNMEDAAKALIAAGAGMICICDGGRGSYGATGTKRWHCPVMKDQKIVDTTGAGDAFGTGATWALINGESLPNALRTGTINAASVIGAIGAQAGLLTDTDMRHRLTSDRLNVEELASFPS